MNCQVETHDITENGRVVLSLKLRTEQHSRSRNLKLLTRNHPPPSTQSVSRTKVSELSRVCDTELFRVVNQDLARNLTDTQKACALPMAIGTFLAAGSDFSPAGSPTGILRLQLRLTAFRFLLIFADLHYSWHIVTKPTL